MGRLARSAIAVACCSVVLATVAEAAQWRTEDGLEVRLSDRTGRFERVTVAGQTLKLADGGGLTVREFTRTSGPPRVVLQIGAEGDKTTWTQASFADWEAQGDYVRRRTGGAPEGEAYLQIGNGKDAGVGMAASGRMPVAGGDDCTI
jgi:hypothetical protein